MLNNQAKHINMFGEWKPVDLCFSIGNIIKYEQDDNEYAFKYVDGHFFETKSFETFLHDLNAYFCNLGIVAGMEFGFLVYKNGNVDLMYYTSTDDYETAFSFEFYCFQGRYIMSRDMLKDLCKRIKGYKKLDNKLLKEILRK